jgi:hypothetical protein
MQAFHNDPAVKSELVDRLKAYAEAGAIINAENVWKDGKGSPSGCVVHDAGLALWPERTGMPKAFGAAIDAVAKDLGSPENAGRFAVEWFDAVPVGEDMGGVAHALTGWLLTDGEHGILRLATTEAVREIVRRVAELHRRGVAGQLPTAAEWGAARAAAMAASDACEKGTEKLVMATAEAAAWNPATAATVISDTLRAWSLLGPARGGAARKAHAEQMSRDIQPRNAERAGEAEKAGLPKPAVDMKEVGKAVFAVIMRAAQADHERVAKALLDLTRRSAARSSDESQAELPKSSDDFDTISACC